jgi:hypothetical protein
MTPTATVELEILGAELAMEPASLFGVKPLFFR